MVHREIMPLPAYLDWRKELVGRMKMKKRFISQMQKKVAVSAVGASAVRGQPKGTIKVVRSFLTTKLKLHTIPTHSTEKFGRWLDRKTDQMGIPWGVARKCLNLFLRDVLYNRYLHNEYGLHALEQMLEVPLDGVVGRFLIRKQNGRRLKSWPTLKRLKAEESRTFQEVATEITEAEGIARVHLASESKPAISPSRGGRPSVPSPSPLSRRST